MERQYYAPKTSLLTVAEAAAFLGISKRQVYRLIAAGQIRPAGRVGSRLRFRLSDLDQSLSAAGGDP